MGRYTRRPAPQGLNPELRTEARSRWFGSNQLLVTSDPTLFSLKANVTSLVAVTQRTYRPYIPPLRLPSPDQSPEKLLEPRWTEPRPPGEQSQTLRLAGQKQD